MPDRAVIFDMDGVLVDSYRAHFLSWRQMAREHGLDMTEQQFAATFGRTSRQIIAHFWGEGLTDEQIRRMDDRKEAAYREILLANFPEMPGAVELLRSLRAAGFKVAIGSSGPPENVRLVRERLGLALFDAVVTGMEVTHGKPDPEVFLLAAGKLGISPARCAVVEDAVAGLQAARAAGMAAVAITGTADRETLAPLADRVVDSLTELSPESLARLIDSHRPAGRPS